MNSMLVGNTASCRACLPCNDFTYPSSKLVCFAEYSRDLLDEPDCNQGGTKSIFTQVIGVQSTV